MMRSDARRLPRSLEPFRGVLAHRFQQPIADGLAVVVSDDEGVIHQADEHVQHVGRGNRE